MNETAPLGYHSGLFGAAQGSRQDRYDASMIIYEPQTCTGRAIRIGRVCESGFLGRYAFPAPTLGTCPQLYAFVRILYRFNTGVV
jgi:hypothetical protein